MSLRKVWTKQAAIKKEDLDLLLFKFRSEPQFHSRDVIRRYVADIDANSHTYFFERNPKVPGKAHRTIGLRDLADFVRQTKEFYDTLPGTEPFVDPFGVLYVAVRSGLASWRSRHRERH